ncbi:MAG: GGDEF domain-containing protein [Bryobacteraceae bacterium]|nr:GGDEF domain-containing protein [Bryobacteraceae bacterium]
MQQSNLISIRDSIEELGQLEDRLKVLLEAYGAAFADVDTELFRLYASKLGIPKPDFIAPREALRERTGVAGIRVAREAFREGIVKAGNDFASRMTGLVEMSDVLERIGRLNDRLRGSAGRQTERLEDVRNGLQQTMTINSLDEMRRSLTGQISLLEKTIDDVRQDNAAMLAEMEEEMATYRRQLDEATCLAGQDPVTRLPNCRALESEVRSHLESGVHFSLILITPQQLALVNRQLGHEGGDELLKQVGERLREVCGREEKVARWRGAEFAFLMVGGLNKAIARSRELVRELTGEYTLPGPSGPRRFQITVRYGIAESRNGDSKAELLARAESLLMGAV